jgi:DNA-binding Lrp family transcriptional regulator
MSLDDSFSKEEEIALKLFRLLEENKGKRKFVSYSALAAEVKDLSEDDFSEAVDKLFDLGVLKAKWELDNNEKWVRALSVAGEYTEILNDMYKNSGFNYQVVCPH